MKKPKQIKITIEELEELKKRIESRTLQEEDYKTIEAILMTVVYIQESLNKKNVSIKKLLKMIFGVKTEKAVKMFKKCADIITASNESEDTDKVSPKGHGRNGSDVYNGAKKVTVANESLKSGDRCPKCLKGKIYKLEEPKVLIRIEGNAPLQATVYELERLRCNLCGEVFSAVPPSGIGDKKYDETAGAMVALLKYGSGVPFYRLEKLQESFGIPLPSSTQWDIVKGVGSQIVPVYRELVRQAAQGEIIHNDDTTMKVLALMKSVDGERKGVYTTAIVAIIGEVKIALFYTGRKHAGENLTEVLEERDSELNRPIQMCDGLSRNLPQSERFATILANCMSHCRRKFVDEVINFPQECEHIINVLGQVYHNDDIARSEKMTSEQRLSYHQQHSGPLLEKLRGWLNVQIEEKKVEPNSGLGIAFKYMLKRWEWLTLFLRVSGAPLDNNICEQTLKRAILHRKNALFYKTVNGAYIGDLFMSLIHSCYLNGVNAFEYLTSLQRYSEEICKNPSLWMPWNFEETIASLKK